MQSLAQRRERSLRRSDLAVEAVRSRNRDSQDEAPVVGPTIGFGRSLIHGAAVIICAWLAAPADSAVAGEARGRADGGTVTKDKLPAAELAAWIDGRFDESWREQRITPAERTTDSEFVRRAFLDLIGRIPSVAEVRAFLDDVRPDKRRLLVEELLQRGAFAAHLANTWRDLLLAGASAIDARAQAPALETWLKLRFSANMPYDQLVRELLTAALDRSAARAPSPVAFYQAAEFKPEVLAANTSRLFLGVQVQCAQCHDHPFAEWKQPQFWSFAAFFNNLDASRADGAAMATSDDVEEIRIPGKDVLVPALFLDGSKPERTAGKRLTVARWITGPDNPYFTRAAVNRIWGSYFGRGFVQPIDDLDPSHPPAYPEIFDALAAQFRLHQYDLKYLVRVITATRVYQLSSRSASPDREDVQAAHFARMPLRRMTSDQVYASFVQATGFREAAANPAVLGTGGARDEFQTKFADSAQSPTEIETTILQALSLMNGQHVAGATDLENSEFLAVVADAPYLDEAGRIETLFLATLSRPPEPAEMELFVDTRSSADRAARKAALADILWTLLNSAEFLLNH